MLRPLIRTGGPRPLIRTPLIRTDSIAQTQHSNAHRLMQVLKSVESCSRLEQSALREEMLVEGALRSKVRGVALLEREKRNTSLS